jgi:uncharacterized membrane protein
MKHGWSGLLLTAFVICGCRPVPDVRDDAPEAAASQGVEPDTGASPPEPAGAAAKPLATADPSGSKAGACDVQDGSTLPHLRLRGVGTEPFWGTRIEGRCVTYSHPEDQSGTRVWTNFQGSASAGTWTGALNGQPFVLRTRAAANCSDGMSDRRYPIAVSLTVGGEERQGCAEPL